MCEVPRERKRSIPPPTPIMRSVLAAIVAADPTPIIWDYARGFRRDTYTIDGAPVEPAAVTGLGWRGLLRTERVGRQQIAYRLTDRGRAVAGERGE